MASWVIKIPVHVKNAKFRLMLVTHKSRELSDIACVLFVNTQLEQSSRQSSDQTNNTIFHGTYNLFFWHYPFYLQGMMRSLFIFPFLVWRLDISRTLDDVYQCPLPPRTNTISICPPPFVIHGLKFTIPILRNGFVWLQCSSIHSPKSACARLSPQALHNSLVFYTQLFLYPHVWYDA